jgi:HEAT repeat protein
MYFIARRIADRIASLVDSLRGEDQTVYWRHRVEQCGLAGLEVTSHVPFRASVSGRRGRHGLRIEPFEHSRSNRGIRVVIDGLSDAVGLQGEGFGTAIEKTLGSREIEIGDAPFDQSLFVRGEPAMLRALLDAETRRMAVEVFAGRVRMDPFAPRQVQMSVRVAYGELRAEFFDRRNTQDEPEVGTLQALFALAERLAPVERIADHLATIARTDPVSRVRGHALATLQHDYASAAAAREALAAALADADPEIRLLAALAQPEAGRTVLEQLATSIDASDECSARAVQGLADRLTLDVGRRVLEAAGSASKEKTALAALPSVARAGGVDEVVRALRHPSHLVAAAAARALGAVDARAAEEPLLEALTRDSIDVGVAAAQALGLIGSARAVLPLKELQARGRFGVDKAAREAIARIQSRLTGATPGQLAIADDASGDVSLSEDPSGRVTLPPES